MENKKVLLIEDDPLMQTLYQNTFELEGAHLLVAPDGLAGIEMAKTEKPALILLDLLMPKMSGYEVLKILKETTETKDIPVIVLSNMLDTKENVEKVTALGAAEYWVKSNFTSEDIVEKVKKYLG
ncbi:MAG: response regulator [Candidatus Omnitrophota bacterium]